MDEIYPGPKSYTGSGPSSDAPAPSYGFTCVTKQEGSTEGGEEMRTVEAARKAATRRGYATNSTLAGVTLIAPRRIRNKRAP